jgi:glutamate carboxypeptidase
MEVSLYEQEQWGNDLYGILHGSGQGKVTLLGHMDTVYPVGTASARPVQVQGNKVLGPIGANLRTLLVNGMAGRRCTRIICFSASLHLLLGHLLVQ